MTIKYRSITLAHNVNLVLSTTRHTRRTQIGLHACCRSSVCGAQVSFLAKSHIPRGRAGGEASAGRLGDDGLPLAPLLLLQSEHGAARHEA